MSGILREIIRTQLYKMIINESTEHDLALEYLSSLIQETQWAGITFLAGGIVRDELLGLKSKDIDITVAAPNGGLEFAEWVTKTIGNYKEGSNPVIYPRFGTAKFTLRGINYKGSDLSKVDVETVMTRKEEYQEGSRKPDVEFGTPADDAYRRDLTVNSLMKDLATGEIKDFTGMGLSDLKNKIIRTPLDSDFIFKQDPLRMLRCIRFAVKLGWSLSIDVIKSLKRNAHMLQTISAERIQDELNKILLSATPDKGIKLLQITGLNKYVIPELDNLRGLKQNKYHAYDVMKHTNEVLKNVSPKLITRIAALFHDIGKYETKEVIDNSIHFYKHEDVGADIAKNIMIRLKYPNDIIDAVVIAIKNHMRTKPFGDDADATPKSLRKLQNDLGDHLENLLDLIDADNKSHGPEGWEHNMPNQVANLKSKMANLKQNFTSIKLPLDGNDIAQLFNLKPSPVIGQLLAYLKDQYLENPDMTREEAIQLVTNRFNSL